MESSLIGIFNSIAAAEVAVKALRGNGFTPKDISVVAKDLRNSPHLHVRATSSDAVTVVGAVCGGIVGLLAQGAWIWVPGMGLLTVFGSIAAEVLGIFEGATVGAIAGGALGWLAKLAVSEEKISEYEDAIEAGKVLVVVHAPEESLHKAETILTESKAQQVELHVPASV